VFSRYVAVSSCLYNLVVVVSDLGCVKQCFVSRLWLLNEKTVASAGFLA